MKKIILSVSVVAGIILAVSVVIGLKISLTDFSTINKFIIAVMIGLVSRYIMKKKYDMYEDSISFIAIAVVVVVLIIPAIGNWSFFTADTRVNVAKVVDSNITLSPETDAVRVINKDMAIALAKTAMSKKVDGVNISTQFSLDTKSATVQKVNGKLFWVFPLDYQGLVKYLKQDSIPGYVKVSAIDADAKTELITNRKIVISRKGWFKDSIEAMAWKESNFGLYNFHFEIDEEGTPFWIISAKKNNTAFGSVQTVDYVTVINAETRESNKVSVEDVHKKYPFLDKVVDTEQAESVVNDYLELRNGWANQMAIFGAKENVATTTVYNGKDMWYVSIKGRGYYFSGLSSVVSNDQSLIGLVFQDSITGETFLNENVSGMDESAAVKVAEGALGNDANNWDVVLPQPLFANNKWYWSTVIVSHAGFYQKVALVEMANSKKVFFGKNVKLAVESAAFSTTGYESDTSEMITVPKSKLLKMQKQLREMQEVMKILLAK